MPIFTAAVIAAVHGSAIAQPGQPQLTVDDQYLLERGYFGTGAHIGGGLTAVVVGFGVGHAIQGRWLERGWIFTLGETVSAVALVYGFIHWAECLGDGGCHSEGSEPSLYRRSMGPLAIGGFLGMAGFRIGGSLDAFLEPAEHNDKVRALHMRLGSRVPASASLTPYVVPPRDGNGAIGGLSLRF